MKIQKKSVLGIKGRYTIRVADMPKNVQDAKEFVRLNKLAEKGDLKAIKKINELFAKEVYEFDNIVPDVYLESIAANMVTAGGSLGAADELRVTFIAVGTGSTAVAAGDTTLDTEVFRDTVDSQVDSNKVAINVLFIGLTEANSNTLAEVGAFAGAASGTVDTGTMASRTLLSPTVVKTNSKTVTIEIRHTIADA